MKTLKRETQQQKHNIKQPPKNNLFNILTVLALILSLAFVACEGPAGPQGPQGEAGVVGPAGDNGSMMWAGPDAPTGDIGNSGDYYLNTSTGEYFGPKDADGWGNPIIVLIGDDGQDGDDGEDGDDGTDGQDGDDGKDGNDGDDGADGNDGDDGNTILSGTTALAGSLGSVGDFYLNTATFDLYGPKTSSSWGSPVNIKGAKGNANVTRYIVPGADFSDKVAGSRFSSVSRIVPDIESESIMQQSAWLVYLVYEDGSNNIYYAMPGYGFEGDSRYTKLHRFSTGNETVLFELSLEEGPGEEYARTEIVRIEASSTEDLTGVDDSLIPDHLDTSDYEDVARHYGFGGTGGKFLKKR